MNKYDTTGVTAYQQSSQQYVPHSSSMPHHINIDSHKVETNDSLIQGNNNVIFGNNNKVYGNCNKIYGNNNAVIGNENIIKGEQNKVEGERNDVSTPFGNISQDPTSPFPGSSIVLFSPSASSPSQPTPTPAPVSRKAPMNSFTPVSTNTQSHQQPYQPTPPNYAMATPTNYQMSTSPVNYQMSPSPAYPVASSYMAYPMGAAPQGYLSQAIVPVMPAAQQVVYANPFFNIPVTAASSWETNTSTSKGKEADVIQDGTMVFMIREWESDYVREFCQLVAMNSGQKVEYQVSCGRTCIVGLGDLGKIRRAIIDLLPQLNMRLKEWSWNTFGHKVCSDRHLFETRLFKEYKKEDVECWNVPSSSSPSSVTATATKAAA